jgi:hypothetical protein
METFAPFFFSLYFREARLLGNGFVFLSPMHITTMPILTGHLNWFKAWFKGFAL